MHSRTRLGLLIVLLVLPLVLLGAVPAHEDETEPFLQFLFAAYTITWAAFFAYAYFMSRKQRDMAHEIDDLRRALERDGEHPTDNDSPAAAE